MSDGFVQQPPDSTGKRVSTEEFTRGNGDVVEIQRIQVVDASEVRQGTSSAPFRTDPTGATTQPVSGTVAISGTVNVDSELTTADLDTGAGTDTRAVVGLVLAESGGGLLVGSAHPLPVSGTLTANAGSGTFTIQQSNVTADYDSGAGTQTLTMFGLALPASGGAVAGGTATNPVRTDPTGTTPQPVSGAVTANIGTSGSLALDASVTGLQVSQGSTTSGQKGDLIQGAVTTNAPSYTTAQTSPLSLDTSGLLRVSLKDTPANTNALKVDGSAVTQPVSQGTAAAASGAWPVKVTDGTNVAAVKAASTAAAATDPSAVVQISPNQPALTTPLNVQGGKTNNNAAPGATNFGTIPALANAAVQSWTEGNQVALSADLAGVLRVSNRPPNILGCYRVNGRTPTYSGLAAGNPLFSMRWGNASNIAIILKVRIAVVTTVAASGGAGLTERELIIARSFTASDTGGTAITLTGNNQKARTSQGTSLVTDMRAGGPLTAGTRTLDANPIASAMGWSRTADVGVVIGGDSISGGSGMVELLNAANGGPDYPIVLATNEGIIIRIGKDAQPTSSTQQTYFEVTWLEAANF